jgi:hypothetical protein
VTCVAVFIVVLSGLLGWAVGQVCIAISAPLWVGVPIAAMAGYGTSVVALENYL